MRFLFLFFLFGTGCFFFFLGGGPAGCFFPRKKKLNHMFYDFLGDFLQKNPFRWSKRHEPMVCRF